MLVENTFNKEDQSLSVNAALIFQSLLHERFSFSSFSQNGVICSFLLQILNVSAVVLANLCVSYIMTSQNEEVCLEKSRVCVHVAHYLYTSVGVCMLYPHYNL